MRRERSGWELKWGRNRGRRWGGLEGGEGVEEVGFVDGSGERGLDIDCGWWEFFFFLV